jgi:hypothetical protein
MSAALFVNLLDVGLEVEADDPALLDYARSFMEAYGEGYAPPASVARSVRVYAGRGELPSGTGPAVQVHRSKHAYWNFAGTLVDDAPRTVRWDPRGVSATVGVCAAWARLDAGVECPPAVAGESLFHLLRSLALYLRPVAAGNLLHASAVEVEGRAVLFTGDVSAGKTTLLTQATVAHGARPLANDRVLVSAGNPPLAVSWPSYSSYCEGTLLTYPALRDAAERYERGDCAYRTQRWPRPLAPAFGKDRKRVYPMRWFTDALGTRFSRGAPLGALVSARLDPNVSGWRLERLNLDRAAVRQAVVQLLHRNCFDGFEPSFCPWHGLPLAGASPPLAGLVDRMRATGIPTLRLVLRPAELHRLGELFQMILSGGARP